MMFVTQTWPKKIPRKILEKPEAPRPKSTRESELRSKNNLSSNNIKFTEKIAQIKYYSPEGERTVIAAKFLRSFT